MTETEKPRKLIFHIGHHKTGTTSIQNAFAAGRVKIEGKKILYPTRLTHCYLSKHVEAFHAAGKVLSGEPGKPNLAAISQRMHNGNFDYTVISGETFENVDPVAARRSLDEFMLPHVTDHTVICYVRPHAGRILSGFQENVKIGNFSGSIDLFAEKRIKNGFLHFFNHVPRWVDLFGDNMVVRPMVRSELVGGDSLLDFVNSAFGSTEHVTVAPGPLANESLCLEDLLVVRLLQDRLVSVGRDIRFSLSWDLAASLVSSMNAGRNGTKLKLHKSLAETIRTAFREDAAAMDAHFFGGRPLFQDDLDRSVDEALPEAQSLEPSDYFNADALRTITVLVSQIALMLQNEEANWPSFLRDRRIAKLNGDVDVKADTESAEVARRKLGGKKLGKRKLLSELGARGQTKPDDLQRAGPRKAKRRAEVEGD